MIGLLLVFTALGVGTMDPVGAAVERYRAVDTYQVTIRSSSGERTVVIRYSYKRPGFVRMDFEQPHRGAVLVYSPRTGHVRLWPFGTGLFALTLSPANRLVRSATGQRADQSDIGALLRNVQALQRNGETAVVREEIVGGARTVHVVVSGREGFTVGSVHRYDLWLDADTLMPARVVSRDVDGEVIETVLMDDLQVNVQLADGLFSP
jgi:outer membrane lipoprotein-sorting protein